MEKLDDETLRKLQLAELEILKAIVYICNKYQLKYFLSGGTLLGAIRHKGFIPWDDDIDISMPVNDFRKFVEIANSELPDNMVMETADTDDTHIEPFGKVRLLNTTFIQDGYNPYGKNNGIWVDVFPLLRVKSKQECEHKCLRLKLSYCCNSKEYAKTNPELFKKAYGGFLFLLMKLFLKTPKAFRKWVRRRLVEPLFNAEEGEYVFETFPWISAIIPTEVFFKKKVMVEFEGGKYCAPSDPDRYLKIYYGDYMTLPPEDQRYAHKPRLIDFEHNYNEIKSK